jgi:hypothetical protein
MFYANLDDEGVCIGISSVNSTIEGDSSYIEIPGYFPEYLRRKYVGGSWTEEIVPLKDYKAEFIDTNPDPVEEVEPAEPEGRDWRDLELLLTDFIVPLSDHPQRAAYMTYRTALRDWPSTESFPDTKPTL